MAGLSGMKEICRYCNRSEPTIIYWIQAEGFPATKIKGSWESDTELIDKWRKEQIIKGVKNNPSKVSKKHVNQKNQKISKKTPFKPKNTQKFPIR